MQDFENIIRKAINSHPMTRYQIAQETGVSESVLSRFANGKTSLTLSKASTLCHFLGLELRAPKTTRKPMNGGNK